MKTPVTESEGAAARILGQKIPSSTRTGRPSARHNQRRTTADEPDRMAENRVSRAGGSGKRGKEHEIRGWRPSDGNTNGLRLTSVNRARTPGENSNCDEAIHEHID
jgi:hypothetical protein